MTSSTAHTGGNVRTLRMYKPKYETLEIIIPEERKVGLMSQKEAVNRYGDYLIVSKKDYDDTRSTSLILKKVRS